MDELKPCPFCGCERIMKYETDECYFICECARCNARSADCKNILDAIRAWNRRPETQNTR